MARKTVVANQKGGVGKTTTAMNLASVLAVAGRRVLLVDFDPQGNATTGFGLTKDEGTGTAAVLHGRSEGVTCPTAVGGLDLLAASTGLLDADAILGAQAGREAFVAAMDTVAGRYDEVLLDCPPAMGSITRVALAWADQVLVPIQCEFFAMEGLAQILAVIEQVKAAENGKLALAGVLLTMYDPALPFHQEVVENLRKHLGTRLCRTIITRDVALAEAASFGVPAIEYDGLGRGNFGYVELGKEMLGHGGEKAR